MKAINAVFISFSVLILGIALFVYSGVYPVGADTPHGSFTYSLLESLRENSIKRASQEIRVPSLDNPDLLLSGGPDYNEMCASCHLKPGKSQSDMSIGLYPTPPNLTKRSDTDNSEQGVQELRRQFWIIKHGIKASGMPAWGPTHDDDRIWAIVAFLQRLPDLNQLQYQILTARGDEEGSHH